MILIAAKTYNVDSISGNFNLSSTKSPGLNIAVEPLGHATNHRCAQSSASLFAGLLVGGKIPQRLRLVHENEAGGQPVRPLDREQAGIDLPLGVVAEYPADFPGGEAGRQLHRERSGVGLNGEPEAALDVGGGRPKDDIGAGITSPDVGLLDTRPEERQPSVGLGIVHVGDGDVCLLAGRSGRGLGKGGRDGGHGGEDGGSQDGTDHGW